MPYLNTDDGFPDHEKVDPLSDLEFRQLMREVCLWSRTGKTSSPLVRELIETRVIRRAPRHWLPDWLQPARSKYRAKIGQAVRSLVHERDGWKCRHCGSRTSLTLDHVVPWSLGGSDDESNLQTLCQSCNSRKGARL